MKLNKVNKLKFSLGGNLAKSLLKIAKQAVEEKVFKPVIKEYGSNTEMFTDFIKQAGEQGITPDRSSKLYRQIVDELPEAKKYYKELNLPDKQLTDGLYLSTKTEQAQKGLKDSKVKDLVYHGTQESFDTFDKNKIGIKWDVVKSKKTNIPRGFYFTPDKATADIWGNYGEKQSKAIKPVLLKAKEQGDITANQFANHLEQELRFTYSPEEQLKIAKLQADAENKFFGNSQPLKQASDMFKYVPLLPKTDMYKVQGGLEQLQEISTDPKFTKNPEYLKDITEVLQKQMDFDPRFKYPQYIVKSPKNIKSLFREHLGKWDWSNPNIHKALIPLGSATAGLGAAGIGATEMKRGSKLKTKRLKSKYK